jgi:hypothetical protein
MSHQSDNHLPSDSPVHDDSLDEVSSIDLMDMYPMDEVSSILDDFADHETYHAECSKEVC